MSIKVIASMLMIFSISAAGQSQSKFIATEAASRAKNAVSLGMSADDVLARKGKAATVAKIGNDQNGLIVEWQYQDATYLLARREKSGVEAYRVIKITPR